MAYRWIRSVFCFAMMAFFSSSLCHAVDVPMIWCWDTWGEPLVEASAVGAHAGMSPGVGHPNYPIQVDSLYLPPALQSYWTSNVFTVAGTTFNFGFWVHINTVNMGVVDTQKIITIYSDGGTNPDIEILHTGNYPGAGFDWDLIDANGNSQDSVTDPFAEDTWVWCNLYYKRHATSGQVILYVHDVYPLIGKTVVLSTPLSINTEGAGAGTSAQVHLSGHLGGPPFGMTIRFGGGYFMDGITSPTSEVLNHREFHSLRPEKNSVTPDVRWTGGAPQPSDDLNDGLWQNLGDYDPLTAGRYDPGTPNPGGAVQTEDYDLSTSVLDGGVYIGKFVYDIGARPVSSARYVYGYYDVSAGTYSVANALCSRKQFEHVIYSGDAQWPLMSNRAEARAIPVVGFGYASGAGNVTCIEAAFVKMWPKGAPGVSELIDRVPFRGQFRAERIGG